MRCRQSYLPVIILLSAFTLLLLLFLPCASSIATSTSSSSTSSPPSPPPPSPPPPPRPPSPPPPPQKNVAPAAPPPVLLLDVDGTLYSPLATGLERAIVTNIHTYCQQTYNLSPSDCDALHTQYGSTIEGLRTTRALTNDDLAAFYYHVYKDLPLHRLLPPPPSSSPSGGDTSGYRHQPLPLFQLLHAHRGPIYITSNSPLPHVLATLAHLGLASFPWAGILTPDSLPDFPTKSNPVYWASLLEKYPPSRPPAPASTPSSVPPSPRLVLLDDSVHNLRAASSLGIRGILVNNDQEGGKEGGYAFDRALAAAIGAIDPTWGFDDIFYLRAKNDVDRRSLHPPTLARLEAELTALRLSLTAATPSFPPPSPSPDDSGPFQNFQNMPPPSPSPSPPPSLPSTLPALRVLDLGAGLLSMLGPVLEMAGNAGFMAVDYKACELNPRVFEAVRRKLVKEEGFVVREGGGGGGGGGEKGGSDTAKRNVLEGGRGGGNGGEVVLVRGAREGGKKGGRLPAVRVRLRVEDFGASVKEEQRGSGGREGGRQRPHLVVGCCLADLYQPRDFVSRLWRACAGEGGREGGREGGNEGGREGVDPLVYLPITFAGQSTLTPGAPAQDFPSSHPSSLPSSLPSDVEAMEAYHTSLVETQGHNLNPSLLVDAMEKHGAVLLSQGASPWRVERERDSYLWECLVYFFGLGLLSSSSLPSSSSSEGGRAGWDVGAWRRRVVERNPVIEVENVDLLFRLGGEGGREGRKEEEKVLTNVYVEFVGPRKVVCRKEGWGEEGLLGATEVEVESICSLISSGTELKVYRGDFPGGVGEEEGEEGVEEGEEMDVSIKGMKGEKMAFPLRYGYSLVGRVRRCGKDVKERRKLLGLGGGRGGRREGNAPLVFVFAAHASRLIVDESAVMVVPPGIAPEDAVYLPSVETALSLVQDAKPLIGETINVIGAGLIGLLVLSILGKAPFWGKLRAVDPLEYRRGLARKVGASVAVAPAELGKERGREVVVEGEVEEEEEEEEEKADTSIEVSGVAAGLQTAIDYTRYGGKVVVGSWYGNHAASNPAKLRLGLGFHRSHLKLCLSQVSRISTELLDRWTKERRFRMAWRLVRELKPSRVLTTRVVAPQKVGEAFHTLDTQPAETLAILIDYREKGKEAGMEEGRKESK